MARRSSGRAAAGFPSFHVVFTLPPAAAEIAFQNKQTVYGLLMRAGAQALMTLAAERLGARIGLIAVLHTWGQALTHHPHVHCLVPGGAALDGPRWVACKPNFLLSVGALSKTFRRLFLHGPETAFRRGELGFFGDLVPLAEAAAFAERVRALRQSAFVVYAKPPFGGPERVLAYLARYTHRTAIANSRLVTVDDDHVAFSYKHYRRGGGRSGVRRLAPLEFIRRFLLHVLPDGFHRIRHTGFLTKGDRGESLTRVRHLLQAQPTGEPAPPASHSQTNTPASRSSSARIAAVSCAASASSPDRRPRPSAATHHDLESPPPPRSPVLPHTAEPLEPPAMRLLAVAAPLRSRSPPCRPPKRARIPTAAPPNRLTVSSRRSRRAKTRRQTRKPSRAFPIAPNRPTLSFNPAYVRSPSAKTQPARQRPHITLQIRESAKV